MSASEKQLRKLLLHVAHLQSVVREAEDRYKSAQQELIAQMNEAGITNVSSVDETTGFVYSGTVVTTTTKTVDESALSEAIGPRMWNKVTTQILDKEKLAARVVTGDIPSDVVDMHTTVKTSRPYVRLTTKAPNRPYPPK